MYLDKFYWSSENEIFLLAVVKTSCILLPVYMTVYFYQASYFIAICVPKIYRKRWLKERKITYTQHTHV